MNHSINMLIFRQDYFEIADHFESLGKDSLSANILCHARIANATANFLAQHHSRIMDSKNHV
jgi:hypothetical protein